MRYNNRIMALRVIENFKRDATREDKIAVAAGVSIAIMAILFIMWLIMFANSITPVRTPESSAQGTAGTQSTSTSLQLQPEGQGTSFFSATTTATSTVGTSTLGY